MVNKHSGTFDSADEQNFECFAVYCGLALHHAKVTVAIGVMVCSFDSEMQLYDKIRRSEQKYRVALEVLAYHSVCHREEVTEIKQRPMPERIMALERYVFEVTLHKALFIPQLRLQFSHTKRHRKAVLRRLHVQGSLRSGQGETRPQHGLEFCLR